MSSNDRITRPPLPRREPQRAWSGAGDVVSRAVDLGYRVVDEYIRQGQRAAERLGARTPMTDAMGQDVQDLAVRMAQYTSDAFTLWLQLVDATLGANGQRLAAPVMPRGSESVPTPPMPRGWESVATAPERRAVRLRLDVTGPGGVEATLDLAPEACGRALTVQALRAADPAKPHLSDVRVIAAGGDEPATLVVRIPDDQPPDLYSGIVVDAESGRLAGTVAIRVVERRS
jgi:hypothetical protein